MVLCPLIALSGSPDKEAANVLDAADGLFKAMKDRNYDRIWNSITSKSRTKIIEDVSKAIEKKKDKPYSIEQISGDFDKCETLCKAYWKGYLENFDPSTVLEQSKWEMSFVKDDKAEIIITYKKSATPAILKMFREDGVWKVGLTETFWTRK